MSAVSSTVPRRTSAWLAGGALRITAVATACSSNSDTGFTGQAAILTIDGAADLTETGT